LEKDIQGTRGQKFLLGKFKKAVVQKTGSVNSNKGSVAGSAAASVAGSAAATPLGPEMFQVTPRINSMSSVLSGGLLPA